jgi:two-component system chemotaxis sensor kinase CheA
MSSSAPSGREALAARIQQLACAVVLGGPPSVAAAGAALAEIHEGLRALDDPGLASALAAAAEAEAAAAAGDAALLASAIERLSAACDGAADAPPPPPPEDDELAVLRADPDLAAMFVAEALDHLGSIEALVLALESAPGDRQILNDVFRPFHTVKGNAGALGVTSVQEVAHKVESLLDLARSGQLQIDRTGIDVVLRAVDLLTSMLHGLTRRLAGGAGGDRPDERARLLADVDAVMTAGPASRDGMAPSADAAASALAADTPSPDPPMRRHDDGGAAVKVDTRKLDNLVDMVGELVIVQSIIQEDPSLATLIDERLTRNLAQLRRITSELQRTAMSMRMVPIRQTFQKMARLVRDLGRKSGKQVELVLSGEDTELDRRVVEDINDPLMHMVRNSMDHGIEPAGVRAARGKAPAGRLSLSAYHQGGSIVIAIADDGSGLDTERIRAKAIAQGLLDPDGRPPADEIHAVIFKAGFSTAERVTEISGRGVGMDVVRRNIEALRGRIEIQSRRGEGTTFLIKLPLTLAIVEGLLLGVGAQRFVLPTFSVRESLRPVGEHVHRVGGAPRMIRVRDNLLPLVRLADVFGIPDAVVEPTEATVVVIEESGRRVALQVDRLIGKQEVVIKSIGETFAAARGVSGGAILGDGRIGLILDAQGIVTRNDGAAAAA